ncbi:hypothetical protein WJX75_000098 [Coccomyxa subellipsoidea]|uniref:ShKT domain-containing protein n=1 Tax=Coccomyxa subellipsoidea TaxID=248742 RepID=A0ABR2YI19_9CHLO
MPMVSSVSFGAVVEADISFDCKQTLRQLPSSGPGVNLNYWADNLNNVPTLQTNIGAWQLGSYRYPGGEKSDGYMWNSPNFTAVPPKPVLLSQPYEWPANDPVIYNATADDYANPPMDFDTFMSIANANGVTPYLVLAYKNCNKWNGRSYQELKEAALAWMRHIVQKGYKVRNFEFSNEAYNGAGWAGGATAQQYASALNDWIPALRQIKPDILISMDGVKDHGTVGDFEPWYISPQPLWYQTILQQAGSQIDYIALHIYPFYNVTYEEYANAQEATSGYSDGWNFQFQVQEAELALQLYASDADRARIRFAVSETATLDYAYTWSNRHADLGHAVALFDLMATLLSHPKVDFVHHWTTRWIASSTDDVAQEGSIVDSFYSNYSPTPVGQALALLGRYLREGTLLQTPSTQFAPPTTTVSCDDVAPYHDPQYTCQQQAGWGKCSESYMQGYCNRSCGRCTASSVPAPANVASTVQPAPTVPPAVR